MRKIDATLSRIRLLLADIEQRETLNRALRDQYAAQRQRVLQASLYGEVDLNTILGLLDDVDRKATEVERLARLLALLRQRAEQELRSLSLTRQAEDAKAELSQLRRRESEIATELAADQVSGQGPTREELQAEQAGLAREVARLQALIAEASELAARTFSQAATLPPADDPR